MSEVIKIDNKTLEITRTGRYYLEPLSHGETRKLIEVSTGAGVEWVEEDKIFRVRDES